MNGQVSVNSDLSNVYYIICIINFNTINHERINNRNYCIFYAPRLRF